MKEKTRINLVLWSGIVNIILSIIVMVLIYGTDLNENMFIVNAEISFFLIGVLFIWYGIRELKKIKEKE